MTIFSTANIIEIQAMIKAELSDPHHILGLHVVVLDEKTRHERTVLVARAFVPGAVRVSVIDPEDGSAWELDQVHLDGFFEGRINGRDKWFRYVLKIESAGGLWTTRDPYSFMPVITDYDLYLFNQGNHYEIYEKLGALPMVLDGAEGVLFAVWAPNARRVSVIGDFNNWDGRRHMMRLLKNAENNNAGIWEIFIPGLARYDRYKFELLDANGALIEKSDPYGRFFELRPSTSTLVYDIEGYEWGDSQWVANRDANDPLRGPINIYELHLGSWRRTPEGGFLTYRQIADELAAYLRDMNYTHVELMPVSEFPFDGSWGYQVTGYYAPTSRFGNPHEFMYFVDTMHKNGIGVILDWVPAHFPKDAHALARFDGSALYEHEHSLQAEHPDWGTLIFNYGRNEVKNFLIASALFWLEKYHIDGFRVDAVASMLYLSFGKRAGQYMPNRHGGDINLEALEFVKHLNSIVLEKHPNVLMIAEESTAWKGVSRPLNEGGLGFNLKWNMGWMNDFLTYTAKDPIHRKYHQNNLTFGIMYAHTENFVLIISHDEVVHLKKALVDKMPGDLWRKCANLRVSLSYMYGHPGKKLLFMGSEFGQFSEWSEARSLDWFLLQYDHHKQIQDFVRDLNALYLSERAFWHDDFGSYGFEWIDCNDAERSLLAFMRKTDNPHDTIYIVTNFTPNPINNYPLGLPNPGNYTEILNSDNTKYGGSGVTNENTLTSRQEEAFGQPHRIEINIPPLGAAVFKRVKD